MVCPECGGTLNELPEHPGCHACSQCEHVKTNRIVPGPREVVPTRFQKTLQNMRKARD